MGVNLLRRARKDYHGMGGKRRLQMVQCTYSAWVDDKWL